MLKMDLFFIEQGKNSTKGALKTMKHTNPEYTILTPSGPGIHK